MTICLQQNYLSGSGFNHTQNYYVHFDSAIGTNNERFDVNIGKVAPDKNYPFMLVKEVSGKLKIQKAMLPDGWQDIFLYEVANIITIKNP